MKTNRSYYLLVATSVIIAGALFSSTAFAQTVGDNHERLPYHLDSIISLGMLGFALLVALSINHAKPAVRVFGIVLAAVGCLAITGGIWALDAAGQFAEMRPHRYFIDPHKPTVMHVLALVFLLAGLALLLIAARQSRRTDELALGGRNTAGRYGRMSRLYHWTITVLFLLLIPMGVFTTMLPYDTGYRQAFYVVHKTVGLTVFLLAGARVLWLMRSPGPALSPALQPWERFAAKMAHYAMYFFLLAFPVSGFVLGTSLGKLTHFYVWDLPLFWGPHEESLAVARLMHKLILPFTFYLVFLGHILGALKHQFIDKHDDGIRRMVA